MNHTSLRQTRLRLGDLVLASWKPGERKQLDLRAFRALDYASRAATYLAFAWPRAVTSATLCRVIGCTSNNLSRVMRPLQIAGSVQGERRKQGRLFWRLVRPNEEEPPRCSP